MALYRESAVSWSELRCTEYLLCARASSDAQRVLTHAVLKILCSKTTMKNHYTPSKMAIIKKTIPVLRNVEQLEPLCIFGWECKLVQPCNKSYIPAFLLPGVYQKNGFLCIPKATCKDAHSSLIPNRPKLETTKISISRWLDGYLPSTYTTEYYTAVKRTHGWYMQPPGWILQTLHWVKKANTKEHMWYDSI